MHRRIVSRRLIHRIVLVVAATAVLAVVPLAQAATPPISGLASQTHPDPAKWYSNSYPAFYWQPAIGAVGYSWRLDAHPATVPDTVPEIGGFGLAVKSDSATGLLPDSVAVADLDGDGNLDVATANYLDGTVSVLLGDGTGGLAAKVDFTVGTGAESVAVGDFNGDGRPDLVTANFAVDTVSVLLNTTTGGALSFAAKTDFATGDGPWGVAVADFDGDGAADLAAIDANANTVSVLLGDGSGGFGARVAYPVGTTPQGIAVGDFDGDGDPDLASANWGAATVSVLLGDGSGGFAAKADFATGTGPYSVAVGDLNGDGHDDLAASNSNAATVSVLLGNGAGGFAAKTDFATAAAPVGIVVADLNGDGDQDLATANMSDSASVLLGNGAGGFAAKTDFAVGDAAYGIAARDLDRDGRTDLVTSNHSGCSVSVLLNTTPPAATAFGPLPDGTWYFHVCTVDGPTRGVTSHLAVNVDTVAPTTRAPAAASVKRGGKAKLRYQVDDARPGSPTATVTIKVRNSRGKVVKTLRPGVKNVNTALTARFTCKLKKGKYRYFVYATDQAGNAQSVIGSNKLTVR